MSSPIPLTYPLYKHPSDMTRKELVSELESRKLSIQGRHEVLSSRLLRVIVDEQLRLKITPDQMDDRQPEKWLQIANQSYKDACILEPNPGLRTKCMAKCNEWIRANVTTRALLFATAKGQFVAPNESPLFAVMLVFATALIMQPMIEKEAIAASKLKPDVFKKSALMSQMCTGFTYTRPH